MMKVLVSIAVCAFVGLLPITGSADKRVEDHYAPIQMSCKSAWAKVTVGKGKVYAGFMMYDGSGNGVRQRNCTRERCTYSFKSRKGGEFEAHYVQAKNIRNHRAGCK